VIFVKRRQVNGLRYSPVTSSLIQVYPKPDHRAGKTQIHRLFCGARVAERMEMRGAAPFRAQA